ncbi:hypothetical protein COCSUDRAFT_58265 [Coccomyxa subellipsoidea C-169]|uniref:Uncharacterized protein n=1 Tax=Coccomyxa subellipsoidea (strain C-169) TaxID=574566 RepID=I0YM98_COCSC|nr:hypothetical protein COCSUDRAFT_58265 [Coccomyxa subellipsoidea C-169]EIE19517.1 hypothetical protein COCSUDRAFT_58265 [Coccomyxa subellipsoidea C-169]|eukprot:XP_005644061.1 hypothetical protein COCSUDRAFT_58265 [Coccomyxa subellipsoidea C-169]
MSTITIANLVEGPVYDVLPPGSSPPAVKDFTFLVPGASDGRDSFLKVGRLTEGLLQSLLDKLGLLGVRKVRNVEAWRDNSSSAVEDGTEEALTYTRLAKAEHPAATVRTVCTKVFVDPLLGCDILKLDAAVVVAEPDGKLIAYLAECKNVLYTRTLTEVD